MTRTVKIGRWVVLADVEKTREAHAKLECSGAFQCGCSGCRNFEALRPTIMAGPLGRILESVGISPPWEVEVYENGPKAPGHYLYGGWFHFVGTIVSGDEAWQPFGDGERDARMAVFEPVAEDLSVGIHADAVMVREPFAGLPIVQLEIEMVLPWVIEDTEPAP